MRSHNQIVKDIGPVELAALTGRPITTVRSWAQRDSIPADCWFPIVAEGLATAAELMASAAKAKAA